VQWLNELNCFFQELRDIHTELTEDDIATLATARLAEEQPRDRMWYRINAVKVLGGKSKLQPTVNARLATVRCHRHIYTNNFCCVYLFLASLCNLLQASPRRNVYWLRPSAYVSVWSLAAFPHYCTDPDVSWENGRGCPLVVYYWADLQSVHGFRCYDNIAPNAKCQRVPARPLCLVLL